MLSKSGGGVNKKLVSNENEFFLLGLRNMLQFFQSYNNLKSALLAKRPVISELRSIRKALFPFVACAMQHVTVKSFDYYQEMFM